MKSHQITLFFNVSRPMRADPIKRNYGKILMQFSNCNRAASAQPTPSSLPTGQNGSDRLLHSRYCGVPPKIKQWSDISLWGQITHDKFCLIAKEQTAEFLRNEGFMAAQDYKGDLLASQYRYLLFPRMGRKACWSLSQLSRDERRGTPWIGLLIY